MTKPRKPGSSNNGDRFSHSLEARSPNSRSRQGRAPSEGARAAPSLPPPASGGPRRFLPGGSIRQISASVCPGLSSCCVSVSFFPLCVSVSVSPLMKNPPEVRAHPTPVRPHLAPVLSGSAKSLSPNKVTFSYQGAGRGHRLPRDEVQPTASCSEALACSPAAQGASK